MTDVIENIFLSKPTIYDDNSSSYIDITFNNLKKKYNEVYILLKNDTNPIPVDFYNKFVPKDLYNIICNKLYLYRVNINILKNVVHLNNICILLNSSKDSFSIMAFIKRTNTKI